MNLVVVSPFGPYGFGQRIVDPDAVAAILAGEHARDVRKVAAPADAAAPPAPAPSADEPSTDPAA